MQEEAEALSLRVLFYPKFHCEPDFIERYWCRARWFTCGHGFGAPEAVVPEAFAPQGGRQIKAVNDIQCCLRKKNNRTLSVKEVRHHTVISTLALPKTTVAMM